MISKIRQLSNQLISITNYQNLKAYKFSKYMNSYEILFTYADYLNLEQRDFLYKVSDDNLMCIFCLKTKPLASFNDDAHVIPYLLGNKFLMHREECKACNEKFGRTIESQLAKFSEKFRVMNGYMNRNKKKPDYLKYQPKSQKAIIKMNNTNNEMRLEVTGERCDEILKNHNEGHISINFESEYIDSEVYKAFMKSIYGVIPPVCRKEFGTLREWINTEDKSIKFLNKLVMYQTILPTFHQNNLVINVFRKKRNLINSLFLKRHCDYFALIGFGNVFFDIPLLSDSTLNKLKKEKNIKLIIPRFSDLVVSDKGSIRIALDMSNSESRTEKISFSLQEFKS